MDPSFQADFDEWYVSSIAPTVDGKVILSGRVRFSPVGEYKTLVRVTPTGQRDLSFYESGLGGGKITRWSDRFYVAGNLAVRRILEDGTNDLTFQLGVSGIPYFSPLQGGDYHVYPDGRILMSGGHILSDSIRGFEGLYNLVWFSNTGYLDTTKTHRGGDGIIYRFKELPDGKFICTGPMTEFDGHATSNIFRVHADGVLDTTFYTGTNWGQAFGYLPLADGRVYVGGLFKVQGQTDTLQLVRFMPDGSLDPTFNNVLRFDKGVLTAIDGTVGAIHPLSGGRLLVTGGFQEVNDVPHHGICIVDSTGQLVDSLVGHGCGPYLHQSFTYGSIEGVVLLPDDMLYVYGAYHGYDDGTTNDTDQRFVTRLYGPDFSTGLREPTTGTIARLYPNPSASSATLQLEALPRGATLVVRDAMGRELQRRRITDHCTTLDLHDAGGGVYTVEVWDTNGRIATERLVLE